MVSKSRSLAITTLLGILFSGCAGTSWKGERPNEVNVSFTIRDNLLVLSSASISHQPARILFGSAQPRSVVDPRFAERMRAGRYELNLQHETLPFDPVVMSLGGVADVIIGSDVWRTGTVTIDYRAGLLIDQKDGLHADGMALSPFAGPPTVMGRVDGREMALVVDTALPGTIVMPLRGAPAGRRRVDVVVAGQSFGNIDVEFADVSAARVGNRILSKFLVSIDYGEGLVGFWRDPRTSMEIPPRPRTSPQ